MEGGVSDVFPFAISAPRKRPEKIKKGTCEKELESGSQDPQTDVGKSNVSVALSVTMSPGVKILFLLLQISKVEGGISDVFPFVSAPRKRPKK